MQRKICKKYYFSVEGETEKWYLEWLAKEINNFDNAIYSVKFDVKVQKNPKKRAKQISGINNLEILHVFDFENIENEGAFQNTLKSMKEVKSMKKYKYILGYSNYCFELWLLLHKKNMLNSLNDKSQYLKMINQCFLTDFDSFSDYKEENNFKTILNLLIFDDVINAINNAKRIMKDKKQLYAPIKIYGYEYYRENPSLSLHEYIEKILIDVGILKK